MSQVQSTDADNLRDYYAQLAEAERFAADIAGSASWQSDIYVYWIETVLPAASAQTSYGAMLQYIDNWLANGDANFSWQGIVAKNPSFQIYLTQANMALDAAMPANPPASGADPYAFWRNVKSLISVNEGARWFCSRVFSDPATYVAFTQLLLSLSLSALNPFLSGSGGGTGPSTDDGPLAQDPNEEVDLVEDLDLPGMKAVSDWFTTLRGYPPPADSSTNFVCNLVQVMMAVRQLRDETLDFWVGDYRDVSLSLCSYTTAAGTTPAAASTSVNGPAILIGQDNGLITVSVDGKQMSGYQYAPQNGWPNLSWPNSDANGFAASLNFGSIADTTDDHGYVGSEIVGTFTLPAGYGGSFYGVTLDWSGGTTSATIAVVAKTDQPPAIVSATPWWQTALDWTVRGFAAIGNLFLVYCLYKEVREAIQKRDTARAESLRTNVESYQGNLNSNPPPPNASDVPPPPDLSASTSTGEGSAAFDGEVQAEEDENDDLDDEVEAREAR